MTENMAAALVLSAGVYLAIGFLLALAFAFRGAARLDASADGASIWFRLFILPGAAVLWPIVLLRWFSGRKINQPIEAPMCDVDVCDTERVE